MTWATRMRLDGIHAYVLHTIPYRETSLLVYFLTKEEGYIQLLAKGARRHKGPWRGLLEPFSSLMISWSQKNESLGILCQAEPAEPPKLLSNKTLLAGLYINELSVRLARQATFASDAYEVYGRITRLLADHPEALSAIVRLFEYHMLKAIGYGVDSGYDTMGKIITLESLYLYQVGVGFLKVSQGLSHERAIQGQTIYDLEQWAWGSLNLSEAKTLMQTALKPHLGAKPIKSLSLGR